MKDEIKIILKGPPLSTQTIYKTTCTGGYPRLYMSNKGKEKKKDYQWQVKQQFSGEPTDEEVEMDIVLFFGTHHRHDVDNNNKLILDSLEGIVLEDDVQVMLLSIRKDYDKENPRAEITIKPFKE